MNEKDLQLAQAQARIAQLESQLADSTIESHIAESAARYGSRP